MNIVDAIRDENLFRPFLAVDGKLASFKNWLTCLRCIFGLPLRRDEYALVRQCTGRDPAKMPREGFDTALLLCGRRSGKSKITSVCGAFAATLEGKEERLSAGEEGVLPVVAPTRDQARIIRGYLRTIFEGALLAPLVERETKNVIQLNTGIRIEVLTGDYRSVRGYSLAGCLVDEAAFFGSDPDSKVKSDTELITALEPGLVTLGGRMIAVTTPYWEAGWCFETHKANWGNNDGNVLVWHAPGALMNPTLSPTWIKRKLAEDYARYNTELNAAWRQDVGLLVPREVVERCIVPERYELLPDRGVKYSAYVDVSGGRSDDAAMCIGHRENETVVVDALRRYKAPHDPAEIVKLMANELRAKWGLKRCHGDVYAADFVSRAFNACGIKYEPCSAGKSQLYLDLLPLIGAKQIELLDDPVLVTQLAGLERRTRSGGRDVVDHRRGGHDDLANTVAGVCWACHQKLIRVGCY